MDGFSFFELIAGGIGVQLIANYLITQRAVQSAVQSIDKRLLVLEHKQAEMEKEYISDSECKHRMQTIETDKYKEIAKNLEKAGYHKPQTRL